VIEKLKTSRVVQVIKAYGDSHAGSYASGLAMNAFLAMFPLILGILAIVGLVIRDPGLQQQVYTAVASVFPADAHDQIVKALQGVKQNAGILGVVSIVGMLWGGTNLFASMEFALTQVFGTSQRDALRQRLMGLVMVVIFIAAILLTVVANSAAAISAGAGLVGSIVGAVVLIALLTAIYRFVPNRTFSVRDILPGAVLAGILIEVFSLIFPLYAKLSHGFNTYGQQFALFFVLATWLSFLSQFILIGAVFNRVRLGAPQDEGLVASSASDSKEAPRPVEAIENEQRAGAGRAERSPSGGPPRSRDGEVEVTGRGAHHGPPLTKPAEKQIVLGLAAVAAGIGALLGRRKL
jgi:membrane protein